VVGDGWQISWSRGSGERIFRTGFPRLQPLNRSGAPSIARQKKGVGDQAERCSALRLMESFHDSEIAHRGHEPRVSVLDCGGAPPLSDPP
jgi:hypothetical protein